MLGNSIHGTGYKGCPQLDVARELGRNVHIVETESNVSWHHNEIIVRISNTARILDKDLGSRVTAKRGNEVMNQDEKEGRKAKAKESADNSSHHSNAHRPSYRNSISSHIGGGQFNSYPSAPEFKVSSSISRSDTPFI